jgi:LysR family hydrogen peroxide-inducible transcriptional activator
LSQQVSRLEAELGCPLFERQGRQITLTDAGRMLAERAAQIVAQVDDTARELRDDGQTGRVAVGAIPTIAPYLLPQVLARFRRLRPTARVEVHELVTEQLARRCLQGEVDLGLLALPVEVAHLQVEPLFDEPFWLVLPHDHPLAKCRTVPVDRLRDEPFVLLDEAHCLSSQIRSFCQRRAVQPVSTGRASQLATVQQMVALGHGLSFVPDMARRLDAGPDRVYRRLAGESPSRTIAACWNPYRYQSKLVKALLDVLRSHKPRK